MQILQRKKNDCCCIWKWHISITSSISSGMDGWKEDEMDLSEFLLKENLLSFQAEEWTREER